MLQGHAECLGVEITLKTCGSLALGAFYFVAIKWQVVFILR